VLSTLPWSTELTARQGEEVSSLLSKASEMADARPKMIASASPLATMNNDESRDQVSLAYTACKEMKEAGWPPLGIAAHPQAGLRGVLEDAPQHGFELESIPPLTHNLAVLRCPVLRLFDEESIRKELKSWEACILRGVISDMISENAVSHQDAAVAIAKVPPLGQVREIVVETVLEELLKTAARPHPIAYYCILTVDLLKLDPKMEAFFLQGVDFVFKGATMLDIGSADVFAEWFALLLSQKQFTWEAFYDRGEKRGIVYGWLDILEQQEGESRHKMLLEEFLYRCARLSYYERLVPPMGDDSLVIPEGMHQYLPPLEPTLPTITEKLRPGFDLLIKNVQSKMPPSALMAFVDDKMPADDYSKPERTYWVVSGIMTAETKIFSQMLNKFARYQKLLTALANTLESKIAVVKAVLEFWENSPGMSVVLMQKLLVAGIVDITAITHFIFSPDNAPRLLHSYMFEILLNTIEIATTKAGKLKDDLASAERKLAEVEPLPQTPDKAIVIEKARAARELHNKALKVLKEVFLGIFQRFVMTLTAHLTNLEKEGKDPNNMWFACTLARLRQVARSHHATIKPFLTTLDMLIFTQSGNTDARINNVFEAIKEL